MADTKKIGIIKLESISKDGAATTASLDFSVSGQRFEVVKAYLGDVTTGGDGCLQAGEMVYMTLVVPVRFG